MTNQYRSEIKAPNTRRSTAVSWIIWLEKLFTTKHKVKNVEGPKINFSINSEPYEVSRMKCWATNKAMLKMQYVFDPELQQNIPVYLPYSIDDLRMSKDKMRAVLIKYKIEDGKYFVDKKQAEEFLINNYEKISVLFDDSQYMHQVGLIQNTF